jgi:outer membrane lipoprotein-sorting protein
MILQDRLGTVAVGLGLLALSSAAPALSGPSAMTNAPSLQQVQTPEYPDVQPITRIQADPSRLAAILKKSEEYCQRLDQAALDFVCLEEVTEMTRYYTPHTDIYLYDYQFSRKDQETKEKRNLISVNGEKANIRDSSLNTVMFQYRNVLFGPVGLLSQAWQAYHDFKLFGEDTINKEKAVVVEAKPKPFLLTPHCYGKIWIKEEDGSVLKIVWDQRSLGNFPSVEEWAKIHDAEPQITAYSEYGFEKNGLRFPSRSYTENAYIEKDKRKFVNAEISILYKNYKFFTVETEIKYDSTRY